MLKRANELYRDQGILGIYRGGKRFVYWNFPIFRTIYFLLLTVIGRNYEYAEFNGQKIKLYYTHETFHHCHRLLDGGMIARENVPLSLLDIDRSLDAVIDVGAHYGIYSVLLKKLNSEATLHTFEPDEENVIVLRGLLKANSLSGTIHEKVVTDHTGTATFYIDPEEGSESNSTTPTSGFKEVEISTIALSDHFDQEHIDNAFVKIDAEGEEFNIMKDLLTADYSYVEGVVEIHPDKIDVDPAEIVAFLESECDESKFIAETSPNHEYGRPMYYFKLTS